MWRHGDPPSVGQMCDIPRGEKVMGLTAIETGNLLAGLHPRDIKKHGYVLTRLLSTLRYLEAKSEKMFLAGRKMSETIDGYKRASILTANRRLLEEARRHTSEEVQGLRDSLARAQRELEEQRSVRDGQMRTSTQVEEELQAQLTALERERDDAIDSLTDLREDLDRSSSRILTQADTIENLRRQLDEAKTTIRVTDRVRQQSAALSEEVASLRDQLRLVTAAAEAADRELAVVNAANKLDEQVVSERDRALADRDAARAASETANREASITKRQRDEFMALLSAESTKLAQVQQELRQVRDHESMTARTAALSHAAMSSRIEVSSSIGADTNVVPSTPAPSREPQPDVATQLIYGEGRAAPQSNPSANIDHLFAMYDQSAAASPMRHGTSSGFRLGGSLQSIPAS